MATEEETASPDPEPTDPAPKSALKGSQKVAHDLLEAGDTATIADHARALNDGKKASATKGARVLSEIVDMNPDVLVPHVEKLVRALVSPHKRVAQTAAAALPAIVKIAPARVAKHLDPLKESYDTAGPEGRDGLVQTFTALCLASVAYQKRLEPTLSQAMKDAEPKVLVKWSQSVLPALKGEPHANVREVVEARLPAIPKAQAQKIADFLGIKLRHRR